jgi:arylsulfatase A-like enzyme
MSRWFAVALLVLCACGGSSENPEGRPPNIVLIIGDDHGYRDFGFMGSEIARTPHLDRLAEEGTLFPFGYATASVCRPSLRSLLTGLHPIQFDLREQQLRRAGIPASPATPLRDRFQTLPALLTQRGYASFQSGKYHEGSYRNAGFTHGMTETAGKAGRKQGIRIVRETMEPLFTFIDAHLEQPFFVWFAPQLPHLPHNAPKEFRAPYEKLDLPWFAPGYYASVTWFDAAVGRLVEHLEERGIRGRTLLVYLADNGWQPPGPGVDYDYVIGGHKAKQSLYELGFRTPIVFNWPGEIAAGERKDDLVSTVDLFPTLLDYAGAPPPTNRPGVDLRAILEGEQVATRSAIIGTAAALRGDRAGERRGGSFLRTQRWHYLWYNDGREALFDLAADPDEERNVAARHPEVTRTSRERIRQWTTEMGDSVKLTPNTPAVF